MVSGSCSGIVFVLRVERNVRILFLKFYRRVFYLFNESCLYVNVSINVTLKLALSVPSRQRNTWSS